MIFRNSDNSIKNGFFAEGGVLLLSVLLVFCFILSGCSGKKIVSQNQDEYREDEAKKENDFKISVDASGEYLIKTENYSAYDAVNGTINANIIVDAELFSKKVVLTSGYRNTYSIAKINIGLELNTDDIVVIQFTAYTKNGNEKMSVSCGEETIEIFLNTTPVTYCIPVFGTEKIAEITLSVLSSEYMPTVIDDFYLINYGSETDIENLYTGTKTWDSREVISVNEDVIIDNGATDCLVRDDYIFAISGNSLTSYILNGNDIATELSSVHSLGTVRSLAFNQDKTLIFVTCRQNGMYIVDATDPYNLSVLSHYDTLEAATGIYATDDYVFVCSRYFGVEIVDVSEPASPRFAGKVNADSEYQDCFVDDHYLYVGVYANKRIDIYDIEDISNPILISKIELDGAGQGCFVKDGILYAATGLNSRNSSSSLLDYGAGTGNGLEIYDVTDPANPELLSVTKIDGRYNYSSADTWDVKVVEGYAYVTSMYNGLFVYDVSSPESPVCIRNYRITIDKEDSNYTDLKDGSHIFSWDTSEEGRGAFYHVALEDGVIYAAVSNLGVYRIENNGVKKESSYARYNISESEKENKEITLSNYGVMTYISDSSIWAVERYEGKIYVAAGEKGIVVLDENLAEINVIYTGYSVRDLKFANGYLYTAEGTGGVSAYEVSGDDLIRLSTSGLNSGDYYVSAIQLTSDGHYIIAQISQSRHMIVDASDPYNLTIYKSGISGTGSMYYRNLCASLVSDNYVGIFGRDGILWYYSESGEPAFLEIADNPYYTESGGMTAVGNFCIAITGNGYRYFSLDGTIISDVIKCDGVKLIGKASTDGDTMVVSQSYSGIISILNIEDLDNPFLIESFEIEGNPDIAYIDDDMILIPCRYGGLIKLTK